MEPIQTTATVQSASANPSTVISGKETGDSKDLAALSYVWILSLVVYATRRDSSFVRFHAKQGIALFAISVGVWFIPYLAKPLELGVLALSVIGFVAAAQGQWKDVPLIGPLSRGEWKLVITSLTVFATDAKRLFRTLKALLRKHPSAIPAVTVPTPASPVPPSPAPAAPVLVVDAVHPSASGQASVSAVSSHP
jgi:uncharacterized membrane protein